MPIFLLVISYLVAEIYVLAKVWGTFGFANTFFALLASGVLGAGIARNQGRFLLRSLQESLSRGQLPDNRVLHGLMLFLGGVLFLVPGFVSDFLALFLVLPGARHAIVAYTRWQLARKLKSGAFRVFAGGSKAGAGMGGFGNFDFRTFSGARGANARRSPPPPSEGWARDVSPKIIDVAPVSSEHRDVTPPGKRTE